MVEARYGKTDTKRGNGTEGEVICRASKPPNRDYVSRSAASESEDENQPRSERIISLAVS